MPERRFIFDAWGIPPIKGDIHREITKEALLPMGFSERHINFLARVGRFQDLRFHIGPVYLGAPSPSHFERSWVVRDNSPDLHLKAFNAGRRYLLFCVRNILQKCNGYPENVQALIKNKNALFHLGRALHTLQDFFSHSNYIDLSPETRNTVSCSLFDLNIPPPRTLKIVYVGLHFFIDVYPHGAFGFGETKDNPAWTKGGMERFLMAKREAIEHTRRFTTKLIDGTLYSENLII